MENVIASIWQLAVDLYVYINKNQVILTPNWIKWKE